MARKKSTEPLKSLQEIPPVHEGDDKRRPKQLDTGLGAPPKIRKIEEAAQAYRETRDRRMKLTEREVTAKDFLINLMHEHNIKTYKYDDGEGQIEIKITDKENVKVAPVKEEQDAITEEID
jgi:hypothetical protein